MRKSFLLLLSAFLPFCLSLKPPLDVEQSILALVIKKANITQRLYPQAHDHSTAQHLPRVAKKASQVLEHLHPPWIRIFTAVLSGPDSESRRSAPHPHINTVQFSTNLTRFVSCKPNAILKARGLIYFNLSPTPRSNLRHSLTHSTTSKHHPSACLIPHL
jgi:hypothetical protein